MKLSELYTSVQGEGPGVGHMTQFIRFAGCNLRCAGWPCDSQHAIDPKKYRHEWRRVSVENILNEVKPYPPRVTLTGGEPFLQPLQEVNGLISQLDYRGYCIEVFTNGTTAWPRQIGKLATLTVIMDWKLIGSGEDPNNIIRINNLSRLNIHDAVKFVIKDEVDFKQAVDLWWKYIVSKSPVQVYYGAVWGAIENAKLVEWVQRERLDWKLNLQTHNYVWPRDQRGT